MDPDKHEHKTHKVNIPNEPKKIGTKQIFIGLAVLLGIILIINIYFTFGLGSSLKKTSEAAKEAARPGNIELALVKSSACKECFDMAQMADALKSSPQVKIIKESTYELDSAEGKALASKYDIKKLPAIVLTGEIEKIPAEGFEKKGDALVLSAPQPPYVDAATGRVEGKVTLFRLSDAACEKCNNLDALTSQVKQVIFVEKEEIVEVKSAQGQELLKKYNLDFAPTLILSKEAGAYDVMKQAWPSIGTIENDGMFVMRTQYPPFMNMSTGKIRGIVNIDYLSDKTCADCYDVNKHKEIVSSPQSFGIYLDKENNHDVSDAKGKELVSKYNITLVPTIVLTGDVNVYPASQTLKQFFSVESDGAFVFRNAGLMGNFKNIATGEVIKQEQQSA